MKQSTLRGASCVALFAALASTASAQVIKVPAGGPNISNGIDFDMPFVASGPFDPAVLAGTGITSITQVGTWTTTGDLMSTGLHNGQNLVSQGGVATVAGNGEALDNPDAGAGWDIVLDGAYDEFQCAFTDQGGFAYDVELLSGGMSLGVGNFTYTEGSPNGVAFRAAGSFDTVQIRFPSGSGGLGIDDLGVGTGPGPVVPMNDDCATAIALMNGTTTAFDNILATASTDPWSCVTGGLDVWYTYTAAAGFGLTIDTCGSGFDTALEVFEGDCTMLTSVACNDDSCGTQSSVSFIPTAGTTYYIRAGGFGTSTGFGQLTIDEALTPVNDDCAGAIAVTEGVSAVFDNTLATAGGPIWPCGGGTPALDLWFTYTPSVDGPFVITTCSAGTTFDTRLELFEGDCANLISVACNDDMSPACAIGSFRSEITYCGTAGTTYYLRTGGFNAASGQFELDITNMNPGPDPATCVETIFASNNGGAVGGSVLFQATFTQNSVIDRMATNTSTAAGTPITADVYVEDGMGGYILKGTATGTSAGLDNPSWLNFAAPAVFSAGVHNVVVNAVDYNHSYTNGTGANQNFTSPDGVITLDLGQGSNTFPPSTLFDPRVWNGILCRNPGIGAPDTACVATNNSTGAPAELVVTGNDCAASDFVSLTALNMPANAFGFFLTADNTGNATPAGSMGPICLGSDIGRGVGGSILNSGADGTFGVSSTLLLPHPSLGSVQVMAGETRYYQGWYRDAVGGSATSNTTPSICVTYQ